jgi:hypothetical protein
MDVNLLLKDEVSVILLWIGIYGILDQVIHSTMIYPNRNYLYALFILYSIFIKLS